MIHPVRTVCLFSALAISTPAQDRAPSDVPFPPSTATAEGVSPHVLADLDALVQSLVDDEEIVGAELLVIKNGRSILHEAYGWNDREDQLPMEIGRVFCVRSMTKPFIGAAVLGLIEAGRIGLDDPIASYLPAFDVDGSRDITIRHLLSHTSGLPFSHIMAADLAELDEQGGIHAVAELGANHELQFEPGSEFQYSDAGTDTLTALIEVVTGKSAADHVRETLLEPLGMVDSACVMTEGNPLRARGVSKYVGSPGHWTRFWHPDDAALFPFFLGSQGLYATLEDYGRFLRCWSRGGRIGKERALSDRLKDMLSTDGRARKKRLLSKASVRQALTPGPYPLDSPTGLPELRTDYGYLMQLWTGPVDGGAADEREVVAFGHTGSDGTHAWVFPESDAMVLYFTQSRNTSSGLRVEQVLGEMFLGVPYDVSQDAPPFDPYLGYYWEGEGDLYRAIIRDGDDLALEIMGNAVVPMDYFGDDRWKLRPNPSVVLAFDRSPTGEVTGYHVGDHQEFRFEPAADLPGADEIAARVAQAHRLDLLETLGPVRMQGALSIESLGIEGELETLIVWPRSFRIDSAAGGQSESIAFDGEQVHYASAIQPTTTLDGLRADTVRVDNIFARFGDWRSWHAQLHVIQRLERGGREVILVRAGDTSAPAPTLYVDAETGRVVREDGMSFVEGLGRIGQRVSFGDFRDVSGMLLPHRSEVELANPMIGTIVTTLSGIELGVSVADGAFELRE